MKDTEEDSSSEFSSEDEDIKNEEQAAATALTSLESAKISDELAELGYYARSMKPTKGWESQSQYFLPSQRNKTDCNMQNSPTLYTS